MQAHLLIQNSEIKNFNLNYEMVNHYYEFCHYFQIVAQVFFFI